MVEHYQKDADGLVTRLKVPVEKKSGKVEYSVDSEDFKMSKLGGQGNIGQGQIKSTKLTRKCGSRMQQLQCYVRITLQPFQRPEWVCESVMIAWYSLAKVSNDSRHFSNSVVTFISGWLNKALRLFKYGVVKYDGMTNDGMHNCQASRSYLEGNCVPLRKLQ